ncbi:MAG TPA: copper chaperone PCu(A)C [Burkholderiales bacterium]|nr:copper chaperone PCu(A)C [Burkholderiales bacterium]
MLARLLAVLCFLTISVAAIAAQPVRVTNAWARATAPGQQVAGVYLDIASDTDARLVGVESPLAGRVQLHLMRMDNGIMRMREVNAIDLPAGRTVSLKPGDVHLMLFDLKRPLKPGDRLPLKLKIEDAKGRTHLVDAIARVRNLDGSEPK